MYPLHEVPETHEGLNRGWEGGGAKISRGITKHPMSEGYDFKQISHLKHIISYG